MIKIIGNKGILEMITIFIIVMFAGLAITVAALNTSSIAILYDTLANPEFVLLSYFIDATLVLIMLLLMLKRHKHHSNTVLFEALEGLVVSFTSFFVFLLLFKVLMPDCVCGGMIYVYSAAAAIVMVLLKDRFHKLRDLTTVVSSIGVGLILGLNIPFMYTLLIMAAVAVYDYIGVFKSNEMMTLAKAVSDNDLSFLLSVSDLEAVPKWGLSRKEISAYMGYLAHMHKLSDPRFKRIIKSGKLPVISQISLGEGDLSLPLMVAVSAYLAFGHLLCAFVALGGVVGIVATLLVLKLYKHPIPAVPLLFSCIGVSTGVAFVLSATNILAVVAGAPDLYYIGTALVAGGAAVVLIDILTITKRMRESMLKRQLQS